MSESQSGTQVAEGPRSGMPGFGFFFGGREVSLFEVARISCSSLNTEKLQVSLTSLTPVRSDCSWSGKNEWTGGPRPWPKMVSLGLGTPTGGALKAHTPPGQN